MITYSIENKISVEEFIEVLNDSSLGERRPVGDLSRIKLMIENASLIIVAKDGEKIVAVARSITDYTYCTYLSDLAVRKEYQNRGIGKELIKQTKIASGEAKLILLSAPAAVDFYPKIGMTKHNNCFLLNTVDELK